MASQRLSKAAISTALAHPERLRIFGMLGSGSLCVCQAMAVLGLPVSIASAHLHELVEAGLAVEHHSRGKVSYGLPRDTVPKGLLAEAQARASRDQRVVADRRLLAQLKKVPLRRLCRLQRELSQSGLTDPGPCERRRAG